MNIVSKSDFEQGVDYLSMLIRCSDTTHMRRYAGFVMLMTYDMISLSDLEWKITTVARINELLVRQWNEKPLTMLF